MKRSTASAGVLPGKRHQCDDPNDFGSIRVSDLPPPVPAHKGARRHPETAGGLFEKRPPLGSGEAMPRPAVRPLRLPLRLHTQHPTRLHRREPELA